MAMRTALAVLLGLLLVAPAAAQPRGQDPDDFEAMEAEGAAKFCSVVDVVGGKIRSTILVPGSWTIEDCRDFADSLQAQQFQVGCIFATGSPKFSWGGNHGRPPGRDCGWRQTWPRR